jgi:hypothetical protein
MKGFIELTVQGRQFLIALSSISSVIDNRERGASITLSVTIRTWGDRLDTKLSFAEVKALIEQAQQDLQ